MNLGGINPIPSPISPLAIPEVIRGFATGTLCCLPNLDTLPEKFVPTLNRTLFNMVLAMLATQKYSPDVKTSFKKEYDYIIVGAGSSGASLAGRLSEKGCKSILLLEAGSTPPILSEVPGIARLLLTTDVNWNYFTEKQHFTAKGLYKNIMPFPAGKVLGGSSIVNAMLWIRGNPTDYDMWAQSGAEGWSYNDVKPYFLKLENNVDPDLANNGYHNVSGPVTASRLRYTPELKVPYLQAIPELGFPYLDPNGATQIGYSDYQANIINGQRCSSAKAYLVPNDKRPNLDILANAFVTKVEINQQTKTATGVYFDFNGSRHFVKARKEIILSAGTVNTAKILMLSGVGPKETLQKFKIPVVADLQVGQNLQDHICPIVNFVVYSPILQYTAKILGPGYMLEYIKNRSGPHSSTEGVFGLSFQHSNTSDTPADFPNYQLYFLEGVPIVAALTFGLKPEVYNQVYAPYQFLPSMWCLASILHPKSVGYVSIRSADPKDPPIIDPKYLEHPDDLKDIVDGMKACLKMGQSGPMRNFGVKPFATLFPGCEHLPLNGDAYLECQARSFTFTLSHQAGTAKMGRIDDPTTVVDPQLRVKDVHGLRVADASIMPKVISGNTNIPCMMIGEKAADIIKETITEC